MDYTFHPLDELSGFNRNPFLDFDCEGIIIEYIVGGIAR